jgi:hypothetical protein
MVQNWDLELLFLTRDETSIEAENFIREIKELSLVLFLFKFYFHKIQVLNFWIFIISRSIIIKSFYLNIIVDLKLQVIG